MNSRLPGAIARAFMMVLLVSTPSLVLPAVSPDSTQVVILVALIAAMLTVAEYASTYPSFVEFRDAPPFNRIRFISLFLMVFLLALVVRNETMPSTVSQLIVAIGTLIGQAVDFPYSPVRLVLLMLPDTASAQDVMLLRTVVGMSYLISLLSLSVFVIMVHATHWPKNGGKFNVWVNLPTFDPTTGGDVVDRLERDTRFNVALGFVLPFIVPALIRATSGVFGSVSFANDLTMIWTVAAWSFLPASLFMRGIAMQRVAVMIREQRSRIAEQQGESVLQPA